MFRVAGESFKIMHPNADALSEIKCICRVPALKKDCSINDSTKSLNPLPAAWER